MTLNWISLTCGLNKTFEGVIFSLRKNWLIFFTIFWHFRAQTTNWLIKCVIWQLKIIWVICFWLPKNVLLLIDRPEGERLLLCAEHMQWPLITGWTGHMAESIATVKEAQRTYSHGTFHAHGAEFKKVWIPHELKAKRQEVMTVAACENSSPTCGYNNKIFSLKFILFHFFFFFKYIFLFPLKCNAPKWFKQLWAFRCLLCLRE